MHLVYFMSMHSASYVLHEHVRRTVHAHEVHETHCICSCKLDALYMFMKHMKRTVHHEHVQSVSCTS